MSKLNQYQKFIQATTSQPVDLKSTKTMVAPVTNFISPVVEPIPEKTIITELSPEVVEEAAVIEEIFQPKNKK